MPPPCASQQASAGASEAGVPSRFGTTDSAPEHYTADAVLHDPGKPRPGDDDTSEQPIAARPSHARESHDSSRTSHESFEPHPINSEKDDDAATTPDDLVPRRTQSLPGPLYTVFTQREKRFLVFMATIAAFFSPLSGNIYFPALNQLATQFQVTNEVINLTLTTYMIFQGLAPTFFGDFADQVGRRPTYILSFTIYVGACIGCALAPNFPALLVLRMLQSSGSSATISLASGVAADISVSSERGTYMGWVMSGAMVGPALGPVLGGILAQYWSWRGIFWFLTIIGGVVFVILLLFLPETGRNIVGNGSIPPQPWNISIITYLKRRRQHSGMSSLARTESRQSTQSQQRALAAQRRIRFPNPLKSFRVFKEKDASLLLLYNGINFAAFYQLTASLPFLFGQIYGYDDLQIGLCFLPFGVGCFLAPLINGPLLDWRFRVVAKQAGISIDKKRGNSLQGFPLERARVPVALPSVVIAALCTISYGWALDQNAPLAVPLVLLFFMGVCFTVSSNVSSTMLVDYYPQSPSTAIAANNVCRCLIGAAATAVINYEISGVGRGWSFTIAGLVVLATTPTMLVLLRWGPGWREERRLKQDIKAATR